MTLILTYIHTFLLLTRKKKWFFALEAGKTSLKNCTTYNILRYKPSGRHQHKNYVNPPASSADTPSGLMSNSALSFSNFFQNGSCCWRRITERRPGGVGGTPFKSGRGGNERRFRISDMMPRRRFGCRGGFAVRLLKDEQKNTYIIAN